MEIDHHLFRPFCARKGLVLRDQNALFSHVEDVKQISRRESATPGQRRLRRRVVQYLLVFLGTVLVADALVGDKGLLQTMKKREEYHALEQTLTRMRSENARLRDEARRLREDPAAIEDLARRELGLIKPGDKLFIIKDVTPADVRRNEKE